MDKGVYEASLSGSVATLNTLIQRDPLILDRVSVTCFHETPLHVAALRGHTDFARALLNLKPKLSTELDSLGRTPLHLASAEGYIEIVREMLRMSPHVCVVRDKDGRTPLHLAAMKGRVEVIKELIKAPESAGEMRERGGATVLHLCVKYNRLEALKLLVEWRESDEEFLNSTDDDGDTILHLAAAFKQIESIKYLLSRSGIKANASALNNKGFTALDVLEQQRSSDMEIRKCLQEAGVSRSIKHPKTLPGPWWSRVSRWMKKYFKSFKGQGDWMEETRGTLMLVATVIATIAFQGGVNPPGGVWQEDKFNCTVAGIRITPDICEAGTSILAYAYDSGYIFFLVYNTVSFMASVSIILLLISGFPLKNKVCMWLLTICMCTAVTFMALAYLSSTFMVTPSILWEETNAIFMGVSYAWCLLLSIIGLMFTVRFLVWLVSKFRKFIKKMSINCVKDSRPLGA